MRFLRTLPSTTPSLSPPLVTLSLLSPLLLVATSHLATRSSLLLS